VHDTVVGKGGSPWYRGGICSIIDYIERRTPMSQIEQLRRRRKEVLAELDTLERMRRGSVVDQYVDRAGRDGSRRRRGPYPLHTFKEKGKTVSRRLRSAEEAQRCREDIARFRRFRVLVQELVDVGEKLSAMGSVSPGASGTGAVAVKKTPKSGLRRTPKSHGS
jgi:hypothetical protein